MKTKWLETACRYLICLLMLLYGLVKIFQAQFYTDNYWKDLPLGQLSGMQLTWAFYSYSPLYETLLGFTEVALGLLVFFKRTSKAGVLFFVPVMINIVLINIVFDIGALGSALPLLAAGLILFIIYFKSYTMLLSPAEHRKTSFRSKAAATFVMLTGCTLAAVVTYNNKYRIRNDERLRGAWEATDYPYIKRIYFEKGDACTTVGYNDSTQLLTYNTVNNKRLQLMHNKANTNVNSMEYILKGDSILVTTDEHGGTVKWTRRYSGR